MKIILLAHFELQLRFWKEGKLQFLLEEPKGSNRYCELHFQQQKFAFILVGTLPMICDISKLSNSRNWSWPPVGCDKPRDTNFSQNNYKLFRFYVFDWDLNWKIILKLTMHLFVTVVIRLSNNVMARWCANRWIMSI